MKDSYSVVPYLFCLLLVSSLCISCKEDVKETKGIDEDLKTSQTKNNNQQSSVSAEYANLEMTNKQKAKLNNIFNVSANDLLITKIKDDRVKNFDSDVRLKNGSKLYFYRFKPNKYMKSVANWHSVKGITVQSRTYELLKDELSSDKFGLYNLDAQLYAYPSDTGLHVLKITNDKVRLDLDDFRSFFID